MSYHRAVLFCLLARKNEQPFHLREFAVGAATTTWVARCWMCIVLIPGKQMLERSSWDVIWLVHPLPQRLEGHRQTLWLFWELFHMITAETWICAFCSSLCRYTIQFQGKNILQMLLSGSMAEAREEAGRFLSPHCLRLGATAVF